MTATYSEAVDQIHKVFVDAWLADSNSSNIDILYWDDQRETPAGNTSSTEQPSSYAQIQVRHADGNQPTIGNINGVKRKRRIGIVTVSIYTPIGDGQFLSRTLAQIVESAYWNAVTTGDVLFRNVRFNEVGRNGSYFQTNVISDFEYDEVS